MKKTYVNAVTSACEIKGQSWVCGDPVDEGSRNTASSSGSNRVPARKLYV